jgi:hypothetical protein
VGLRTECITGPATALRRTFFRQTLEPLGFEVRVHPHNHQIGAQALKGQVGPAQWKYRMGNVLSGRDPAAPTSALSLMCIARRVAHTAGPPSARSA